MIRNKKLNNKKGYSAINIIIGMLVLLLTFSLIVEFTLLGYRYSYVSQTASFISRTVGMQGGISTSRPQGYPEDLEYHRSQSLYSNLRSGFEEAGFDTWMVYVNGRRLTSGTNLSVPEQEEISIRIRAGFNPIFDFRGNSSRIAYVEADRIIYSSFTPRFDGMGLVK
jgi:hypothetical protein